MRSVVYRLILIQAGMLAFAASLNMASAQNLSDIFPKLYQEQPRDVLGTQQTIKLTNGITATTIIFRHTRWELKNLPQSSQASDEAYHNATALPESERLNTMNRIDDHTQVWSVSLASFSRTDSNIIHWLKPTDLPNEYHRELAFLGCDSRQAWFAYMPIYEWVHARKQMGLTGGDDTLAAAIRGLSVEDRGSMTANSVPFILVDAGAKSLTYLKPLIESTNAWRALRVVDEIKDDAAEKYLIELTGHSNPETAKGARQCLEWRYRAAAMPLYVKWLESDAGKKDVSQILRTLEDKQMEQLRPFLPRVMASPSSFREYRLAFEIARKLQNNPIPETLLQSEKDIRKYGSRSTTNYNQKTVNDLVAAMSKSKDTEAAAVIAVSLAIAVTKGDWIPVNKAGMAILDRLPNNQGHQFLQQMKITCRDPDFTQRLAYVEKARL